MNPITPEAFGRLPDGRDITQYWIGNQTGVSACICNLGATITQLWVPGIGHERADVVLGYDNGAEYRTNPFHIGVTIGRYANRIANARFTLNEQEYQLTGNVVGGKHQLHGGPGGFGSRLWQLVSHEANAVTLRIVSPHADQGYPGNLTLTARFHIEGNDTLVIDYAGESDAATVANVTNHSYFNLAGQQSTSVLEHELYIPATRYTATDEDSIPTGVIKALPPALDFSKARPLGDMIDNPVLMATGGYDHNYVFDTEADSLHLAAILRDPRSSRTLTVRTTEPGMQLYTSNHLRTDTSKTGAGYQRYQAVCLETQHFPDSPNHPHFPSTVVSPQAPLRSTTHYQFGLEPM
ncbi:MAG: aldose epimerase family protein [Pseudomonadota bacterium]